MSTSKAVLYARFSPGNNQSGDSAEAQLDQCRAYCKFHELEVIGEFKDEWVSGETDERPGFQEAIALTCKAKATMVVYSLSRFARCTADTLAYSEIISKAKANLASLKENLDTNTSVGRFFFTVMAALAELNREQIGERTSDAMRTYQAAGRIMGAKLPFGYKVNPDNPALMVECEREQEIVSDIILMRAEGLSFRAISKRLWLEGHIGRREPKFEMKKAERGTGRKMTKTEKVIAWSIGIIGHTLVADVLKRANGAG